MHIFRVLVSACRKYIGEQTTRHQEVSSVHCGLTHSPTNDSVCRFADSIARVDFPIRIGAVRCDLDCGDGEATIRPLVLPESARRARPPGCKVGPAAAECSICRRKYSSAQLLQMAVAVERRRLGDVVEDDAAREQRIRGLSALPRPPPWPETETSGELTAEEWEKLYQHHLFLTEIGIKFQKHWDGHAKGCFKASATNSGDSEICRYMSPWDRVSETYLDDHNVVHLRRSLGMEYNNPFNEVTLHTMRCNNDVRLLFDGTASDVLDYILKYVAKRQNKIDKFATLALAAWTRKSKQIEESGETKSEHGLAVSLLQAVVHGVSNKMEMPDTMAAYNIYAGGPFSKSHETVSVLVLQAIAILHEEIHEAQVEGSGKNRQIVTSVDDYIHRAEALEDLCLMELYKLFEKIRKKAKDDEELLSTAAVDDSASTGGVEDDVEKGIRTDACPAGTTFRFAPGHPQFRTHMLRRRENEVIAVAAMDGLPDREHLDSEAKKTRYAMRALVMFKPFRSKDDLLEQFTSWWEAFSVWKPHAYAERYLDNEQDLFDKRRCAADMRREQQQQGKAPGPDEAVVEPTNENEQSEFDLTSDVDVDGDADVDRAALFDVLAGATGVLPGADGENDASVERHGEGSGVTDMIGRLTIAALPGSVFMEPMLGDDGGDLDVMKASIEEQMLRARDKYCGLLDDEDDVTDGNTTGNVVPYEDLPMRVELIKDAIADSSRSDFSIGDSVTRSEAISSLRNCPTLRQVSEAHTLNAMQHIAFKIIGSALLNTFRTDVENVDMDDSFRAMENDKPEQLKMYLGGAAGTGKTQLVRAVQSLAEQWGRRGAVRTCAFSGIAAKVVGGRTVHGLLGIGIKGAKYKATEAIRARVRSMKMLFVDEVSMLPCSMMKTANDRLNDIMDWSVDTNLARSDAGPLCGRRDNDGNVTARKPVFGGLQMIFVGDMKQLPPVGGLPLYKRPSNMESANGIGYMLWRMIDTATELSENIRQARDPAYGALLSRFRDGDYSNQNDWAMLNSRFAGNPRQLAALMETSPGISSKKAPMVIVQTNAQRRAFNSLIFGKVARQLPGGGLPIRMHSRIWTKRGSSTLTMEDRRDIARLPPDSAKPFSFILNLFVGMPVMVIWNVAQMLGVANGSVGQVAGFRFSSTCTFDAVTVGGENGYQVREASELPDCVYVRIENPEFERIEGLPSVFGDDVMPISPRDHRTTPIRLPGRTKKVQLRVKQVPIVPAFACTVYKVRVAVVLYA